MRISKILASARRTLADPKSQRWTDDDLLAILEEGQMDFCQQTEVLEGQSYVYLEAGKPNFDLPPDCWRLTRALCAGVKLPFLSHFNLDSRNVSYQGPFQQNSGSTWEHDEGVPQALVYDRRSQTECKVYPIPTVSGSAVSGSAENAATVVSGDYVMDTFGIATEITGYTLVPIEGVTAEDLEYGVISDPFNLANPDDSTLPAEESEQGVLRLYYTRVPTEPLTLDGDLETPPVYDIAMKFYVTGQALLNDLDAGYQQKGSQQLSIYERHVATAKRDRTSNFTRAHIPGLAYRRGV